MSQVLDDLVALLSLEPIEENLFRGRSQDLGFRQLFGGQVLGQSLSAATSTMTPSRSPRPNGTRTRKPTSADVDASAT